MSDTQELYKRAKKAESALAAKDAEIAALKAELAALRDRTRRRDPAKGELPRCKGDYLARSGANEPTGVMEFDPDCSPPWNDFEFFVLRETVWGWWPLPD